MPSLTGSSRPRLRDLDLREARANRDAEAGRRFPEVNASASTTDDQLSSNGQLPTGQIPGISRR